MCILRNAVGCSGGSTGDVCAVPIPIEIAAIIKFLSVSIPNEVVAALDTISKLIVSGENPTVEDEYIGTRSI